MLAIGLSYIAFTMLWSLNSLCFLGALSAVTHYSYIGPLLV
jgi:hypothetical protein